MLKKKIAVWTLMTGLAFLLSVVILLVIGFVTDNTLSTGLIIGYLIAMVVCIVVSLILFVTRGQDEDDDVVYEEADYYDSETQNAPTPIAWHDPQADAASVPMWSEPVPVAQPAVEQHAFCAHCGTPLKPGAAFCAQCGNKVETE